MNPDGILSYQGAVGAPLAVYQSALIGLAGAGLLPHGLRLGGSDLGIAHYQMTDLDTLRSIDALEVYDNELRARALELDKDYAGIPMPDEARDEFEAIGDALVAIEGRTTELKARQAFVQTLAGSPAHAIPGAFSVPNVIKSPDNVFDLASYRQKVTSIDDLPSAYRDGAMRALDTAVFPTTDKAKAQEHISKLIDPSKDRDGVAARRILGTGSPTYMRAFGEYATKGYGALGPSFQAALQTYTDADGGFAIPFTIDPTFLLTSDGVVNPLRDQATVKTITTKAWEGITTAGVTAGYAVETAAAGDAAPTDIDGPKVTPVRGHVFIPFTAEYAEDYGAQLQGEIGKLIQDSKDVLEGDKFAHGSGTNEPEGIIAGIVADTTSLVPTITNDVFARADLNKLEGAVPPRFRSKAAIDANKRIMQTIRSFGTAGEPANALYDATAGTLLGYPFKELSAMDDVATDAKLIVLMGDFKAGFVIVDRLGMAVEYIPQVFDGNGVPLGRRGLYARWRNSSKVLIFNAFRLLKVQ